MLWARGPEEGCGELFLLARNRAARLHIGPNGNRPLPIRAKRSSRLKAQIQRVDDTQQNMGNTNHSSRHRIPSDDCVLYSAMQVVLPSDSGSGYCHD